jgi:hypothetical protein
MPTIACVTAVTPDLVNVVNDGNGIHITIDALGIYLEGVTQAEQLHNLAMIAGKLLNAHDAIAAQQRLFSQVTP